MERAAKSGHREHLALGIQPFDRVRTIAAPSRRAPRTPDRRGRSGTMVSWARSSGISSACISKARIAMSASMKKYRSTCATRNSLRRLARLIGDAHAGQRIVAAEHAHARLVVAERGFLPNRCAIEEALHVGQEGHELLVVALAGTRRGSPPNSSRTSRQGCRRASAFSASQ